MSTLAFIDEAVGANYQSLSSTSFTLGIVDPDSSGLTTSQLQSLQASGKHLISYLSIGEAENFRSYWQSSWNSSPPSFLMGQDPSWPGDYYVKYWDPAWQNIIINKAVSMAKMGYNGIMLDVVDAYTVPAVANADGGIAHARADMIAFVEAISAATKAVNPNFKVIQNNAMDLLTTNPDDPTSATNTSYLSHIDGLIAEDTFYNPDNTPTGWGSWNQQYLAHAVSAGKTVLSIDYPSDPAVQQSYVTQAIAHGYVPFATNENLDTNIPSVDYQIPSQLPSNAMASLLSGSTSSSLASTSTLTSAPTTTLTLTLTLTSTSHPVINVPNGYSEMKATMAHTEFVYGPNFNGHSFISNFLNESGSVIDIASTIYPTVARVMANLSYNSHGNAVVDLGTHGYLEVIGAPWHSLTAADFHIG